MKAKQLGITLIEALVVLSVLGILMAVGLPSFQNVLGRHTLTSNANEMNTGIQLAKAKAVEFQRRAELRPIDDQTWDDGWEIVIISHPATGENEQIYFKQAYTDEISITQKDTANTDPIVFNPRGRLTSPNDGAAFVFKTTGGMEIELNINVTGASAVRNFKNASGSGKS